MTKISWNQINCETVKKETEKTLKYNYLLLQICFTYKFIVKKLNL